MKYFESILQIIPSVHSSATLLSCPSSSPRLSSLLALHSSPSPSNPKGPSFPSSISASTLFAASSLILARSFRCRITMLFIFSLKPG